MMSEIDAAVGTVIAASGTALMNPETPLNSRTCEKGAVCQQFSFQQTCSKR
jgi:hypothetical protein